ncbi:hypothetical protein FHS59_001116 [Algoriphagus iocasae]|uniref:Uncharacterized protein n=1 Tax=Algoriphagus iocasae TaxID=1836499 RepID=A0A841MU07_9BACT|nr:hypothetical protein [Algoriphagus iocasae]MBB6325501.1 hypothetical protein [Algoriphagus iocasae]
MNESQPYKSPNGLHKIELYYIGEIKFGPTYYSFSINGNEIKNKIVGRFFRWDPKSKYLAIQEWLTIEYQDGPITALLIFDLVEKKTSILSIANKGFIEPIRFEGSKIIYKKEYFNFGGNKSIEFETDLNEVKNWDKIELS